MKPCSYRDKDLDTKEKRAPMCSHCKHIDKQRMDGHGRFPCKRFNIKVLIWKVCNHFEEKVMDPKSCIEYPEVWKKDHGYTRTSNNCGNCKYRIGLTVYGGSLSLCRKLLNCCEHLEDGRVQMDGRCDLWEKE